MVKKSVAYLIFLIAAQFAHAQLSVQVTSANQSQAILQETGFGGTCTIQLSTSPSLSPLHPDVDGTEYAGSSTDTGRADTITSADGSMRQVTLGHMNADRSLSAFTTYYWSISGCGSASGSFSTTTLASGTTRTDISPWSATKTGNLDFPTFDWTTSKTYTDPTSGVQITALELSNGTWRTGCGATCTAGAGVINFADWNGTDGGWTTPGNIITGGNSTIGSGDTTPIFLWADTLPSSGPFAGILPIPYDPGIHRVLHDVGLVFSGSSSSGTGSVNACIVFNPTGVCQSSTINIPFTNVFGPVVGTMSDVDGAFPVNFPKLGGIGDWISGTVSPLIRQANQETNGTATVSGSTLTIASPTNQSHFSEVLTTGNKIFISGSSPGCTNNLCTVAASPSAPGIITVQETPTATGAQTYRAYGWGIKIWNTGVPAGTITFKAGYKLAGGGTPVALQSLGDLCSTVSVTSGDGKTGYLCYITAATPNAGSIQFIADDGTSRFLIGSPPAHFDDIQGNVWYSAGTDTGQWVVNKNTYTGDYTTGLDFHYLCSSSGVCPALATNVTVTPLMSAAGNSGLDQQIEANQGVTLASYNSSIFGTWLTSNPAIQFSAFSGHVAAFTNIYSGQSNPNSGGPGWIAIVDLSQTPAKVITLIHTLDGTGEPDMRYSGLHTTQANPSLSNWIGTSGDPLSTGSTSVLFGGPFSAVPTGVLNADGVTWNANTSLPGPPWTSVSYYSTCPTNTFLYIDCVTLRFPQGGVCNRSATTTEKTNWPCPWDINSSQYPVMQVGDHGTDSLNIFGDNEQLRILSITPDTGTTLKVVFARNSTYDYCSFSPWHGQQNSLARQSSAQLQHLNGWTFVMMPGLSGACSGGGNFQYNGVTTQHFELDRDFTVHSAAGIGPTGNVNIFNSSIVEFDTPIGQLAAIPPAYINISQPSFASNSSQIGGNPGSQSYLSNTQIVSSGKFAWAIDTNSMGSGVGNNCIPETIICGSGVGLTNITGNIYTLNPYGGLTATKVNYKTQPLIGWAGQHNLKDISGPGSLVDSTPFTICYVLAAGECHAGSIANQVYVNVPSALAICTTGISWANAPCGLFGFNAPLDGIRQFRIYGTNMLGGATNGFNGNDTRYVSESWSSHGRPYPFDHSFVYPNGKAIMIMGNNMIDDFSTTGFFIKLPPWQETTNTNNQLKNLTVMIPAGSSFAEVQFGYSRYLGASATLTSSLNCTMRTESCEAGSNLLPFAFASEAQTGTACSAGCTINVPVVGPNVVYYQVRHSNDDVTWTTDDIQARAIQ